MKKILYDLNNNSYTINIGSSAEGVQIQQGTVNSSQASDTYSEIDYDKIEAILNEIANYTPMFKDTYGDNSVIAINALNEARRCAFEKKDYSKLIGVLSILKAISLNVSSSLISTGILELLKRINI